VAFQGIVNITEYVPKISRYTYYVQFMSKYLSDILRI